MFYKEKIGVDLIIVSLYYPNGVVLITIP